MSVGAGSAEGKPLSGRAMQFHSGGVPVNLEWFSAEADGPRPAVIMLHGADGLSGRGEQYRSGARRIAEAGVSVGLLHYLDRTNERRASWANMVENVSLWLATVRESIDVLAGLPEVDEGRIGIIGISLGGLLGIAAAGQDSRVRALVDYFAPVPPPIVAMVQRLPPTLILHGARDPVVPVSHSHGLVGLLERHRALHELVIYPDEGHGFLGEAQRDADARVAAFLGRHLA